MRLVLYVTPGLLSLQPALRRSRGNTLPVEIHALKLNSVVCSITHCFTELEEGNVKMHKMQKIDHVIWSFNEILKGKMSFLQADASNTTPTSRRVDDSGTFLGI